MTLEHTGYSFIPLLKSRNALPVRGEIHETLPGHGDVGEQLARPFFADGASADPDVEEMRRRNLLEAVAQGDVAANWQLGVEVGRMLRGEWKF